MPCEEAIIFLQQAVKYGNITIYYAESFSHHFHLKTYIDDFCLLRTSSCGSRGRTSFAIIAASALQVLCIILRKPSLVSALLSWKTKQQNNKKQNKQLETCKTSSIQAKFISLKMVWREFLAVKVIGQGHQAQGLKGHINVCMCIQFDVDTRYVFS